MPKPHSSSYRELAICAGLTQFHSTSAELSWGTEVGAARWRR